MKLSPTTSSIPRWVPTRIPLLLGLACLFSGALAPNTAKAAAGSRPNVVLFYADDLGWGDLSTNKGQTPTPNIDRIFREGLRCDNYTTHAVCSPSRAGLLTGRHYIDVKAGPLTGGELAMEETTIAESFKAAGYATGAFGKWHNGAPTSYGGYEAKPGENLYPLGNGVNAHGFDRFVGYYGGGWDYFTRYSGMYKQVVWYHDRTNMPDEKGYTTDLITKHAIEFMAGAKGKPFFCYIPHEAVHAPIQAKYEDILRVPESVRAGTPLLSKKEYEEAFATSEGWTKLGKEQARIIYSAMLICLDDNIGKVLGWLEKEKLLENTIVMFASDNGATAGGSNLPFRGTKHTLFEGGIHVPCAMWWKGSKLQGGGSYQGDFGFLDVYPTLCALAGIERQPGLPVAGRDLSKQLLSGQANEPATHQWVWTHQGAVREGQWKLVYELGKMQLFDLKLDPGEANNLAEQMPDKVKAMIQHHETWLADKKCTPSYAVPKVNADAQASPEGEVLEFYAEQTQPVAGPVKGLQFIFALGYGDEYRDAPSPGDVIEYDLCVAEDGRTDGFFYTPSSGWNPRYLARTGYDQFGRLQQTAPAPRGGKGVWEHRVLGTGDACPNRVPFNIMVLCGRTPGTYHFYIDNLVVRKADGRIIPMWQDGSHTSKRWQEKPFMITPDHPAFTNLKVRAVKL